MPTIDELIRRKVAAEHVVSKSLTDPSRRLAMGLPLYSCSCGEWASEDANFARHLEEQIARARASTPRRTQSG